MFRTKPRSRRARKLTIQLLETRVALAGAPELVADIDSRPNIRWGLDDAPNQLADLNGTLLFSAANPTTGVELWKSNGTKAGTQILADLIPGTISSFPQQFTRVGDVCYFVAGSLIAPSQLWKTDGTAAGTVMVRELSDVSSLANIKGTLYFTTNFASNGYDLWKSSGTAETTVKIAQIDIGVHSTREIFEYKGIAYFRGEDAISGTELWRSNGTAQGTFRVKDINPGSASSNVIELTNLNGSLYFFADDGTHGYELWKSDGTAVGTTLVKDINPGAGDSNDRIYLEIVTIGQQLYFAADDGVSGVELWRSNGSAAGTVRVADIAAGKNSTNPRHMIEYKGQVAFVAVQNEVWVSSGSVASTKKLEGALPGTAGVAYLANQNGKLIFTTVRKYQFGATNGLWASSGVPGSATLLSSLPGDEGTIMPFIESGDRYFFTPPSQYASNSLWRTDGTTAGTENILDAIYGTESSNPDSFVNVNGTLYFSTDKIDDAPSNFWMYANNAVRPITGDFQIEVSTVSHPENVGGKLYFLGDNITPGLWTSDGTNAGTHLVKDLSWADGSSSNLDITENVNGTLYFRARGPNAGLELWKSDGTSAGTQLVLDCNPGAASSYPKDLVNVNGTLFFAATDESNVTSIWKSDGTAAGTIRIATSSLYSPSNLTNVNGTLYFSAQDDVFGVELWRSDGTVSGTNRVLDLFPGLNGAWPHDLTDVNGTLYFFASYSPFGGQRLFKLSPGSSAPVRIEPDSNVTYAFLPSSLVNVNGVLYFSANDGYSGTELWKTTGFPGTTVKAHDLTIGGSDPRYLYNVGGTLFFSALTNETGRELWKLSNGKPNLAIQGQASYNENAAPVVVAPTATLTDPDSNVFESGSLRVAVTGGRKLGDVIAIRNEGSGAGKISILGNSIQYGGASIGEFIGGINSPLLVYLNVNATRPATQALLRNITFHSVSNDPGTARMLGLTFSDGDGGTSSLARVRVNITAHNDGPTIANFGDTLTYTPQTVLVLGKAATFSDPDSATLASGTLTLKISAGGQAQDRLVIREAGYITLSNGNIQFKNIVIGTFSGGTSTNPLKITWNSSATPTMAQAALRNLSFTINSATPAKTTRKLVLEATDGSGGTSEAVTKLVQIA